jgi:glycosyltransferase involved in cell wall biosynthesis
VVTVHDLLFLTHPHRYPLVDRALYTFKYKSACKRADRVVTVSRHTADQVQEHFGIPPERIRVTYQSCDPAFRIQVDEASRRQLRRTYGLSREYILFVGSLVARKGVGSLLQALAGLSPSIRPELVVVGTGPLERELRRQAESLNLTKNVRFLGRVPSPDLPGLYQAAHVFAYPSEAEGFGIPILEALCSRTPVVTSTGSCFAEAGGDAALYVPPGDIPALTDALTRTVTDQSLRERMVAKGVAHAANFHIKKTSARLMNVYNELSEFSLMSAKEYYG